MQHSKRFSRRRYPLLYDLADKKRIDYWINRYKPVFTDDSAQNFEQKMRYCHLSQSIIKQSKKGTEYEYLVKVSYLCNSFIKDSSEAIDSICNKFSLNRNSYRGIWVFKHGDVIVFNYVQDYIKEAGGDFLKKLGNPSAKSFGSFTYYLFKENGMFTSGTFEFDNDSRKTYIIDVFKEPVSKDYEQYSVDIFLTIKNVLLFMENADVAPKVCHPNGKIIQFHCKYKNDLPFPIQTYDSNWYRVSTQSHPFAVRGHWRNQAHGRGLKKRKLKYIDPFMKNGYTKGSYMLNE